MSVTAVPHVRHARHDLGDGIAVTRLDSGTIKLSGPKRIVPGAQSDLLHFCLQVGGYAELRQRARVAALSGGDGVLFEAQRPWSLTFRTRSQGLILEFPRQRVPVGAPELAQIFARRIEPRLAGIRLLSAYLRQLDDIASDLPGGRQRDAGHVAMELLAMTLREIGPVGTDGDGDLLAAMRRHVVDNLQDSTLTVEALARRHRVSVRHAHALFAGVGTTPAGFLREQRLLAAAAKLSDQRPHRSTIAEIAATVGFLELRTFERAFRRHFGVSPAQWRRQHSPTASAVTPRWACRP